MEDPCLKKMTEKMQLCMVPRVNHGISSSDYYDLCLAIDPLQHSTNYGIDIYLRVLDYVLF